ncbi:imidazolonepropionase [Pseudomonadota bacterium]
MEADWIVKNVTLATLQPDAEAPYGKIENGALAVKDGKICWLGKQNEAPAFPDTDIIDGEGGWITPGLIDCHTHLVYAGNRAEEFEQRLKGMSYEAISKAGGGIKSTVSATRNASDDELLSSALHRLNQLRQEGVTTVEIKSGYGLNLQTELRMLRTARALERHLPITVKTSFLGAHAVPSEYEGRADEYITLVCEQMLPQVAEENLADAVDLFCETIAFNLTQCRRVFETAQRLGLDIKGHVEQLSSIGGAGLVAEFNGLSVDHLEYLNDKDIPALKQNNVVAVLLPAAFYYLNETQRPPIDALRKAQVAMAVASDCNPGSAPVASLLTAMNLACVLFGLTSEEALRGTTCHAAQALGLGEQKGQLKAGYDADLLLWDIQHPAELSYSINMNHPKQIWVRGKHAQSG